MASKQLNRLKQSYAINHNSSVKQSWCKLESLINSVTTPSYLQEKIPHSRPSGNIKSPYNQPTKPMKSRPYSAARNRDSKQKSISGKQNSLMRVSPDIIKKKSSQSLLHDLDLTPPQISYSASPYKMSRTTGNSEYSTIKVNELSLRPKHRSKSKKFLKKKSYYNDSRSPQIELNERSMFGLSKSNSISPYNQDYLRSPEKSVSISMTKVQATDVPSSASPTPFIRKREPVRVTNSEAITESQRKQSPLFFKVRQAKQGRSPSPDHSAVSKQSFPFLGEQSSPTKQIRPHSTMRSSAGHSKKLVPQINKYGSFRSSTPQFDPVASMFDQQSVINQSYLGGSFFTNQSASASPARRFKYKSSALITIDADGESKSQTLNPKEQQQIFLAKCSDLNIQYFQNQFTRFQEYCHKHCINRKVALREMGLALSGARVLGQLIHRNHDVAHLDIRKNQIGDMGAAVLAFSLRKSLSLMHLNVQSNEIGHEGGNEIFRALQTNESIISLDISSSEGLHRNRIGPRGMPAISKVLSSNKVLTLLNLSGNAIGNDGVHFLVKGLKGNKTLEYLGLGNNEITHVGATTLMEVIPSTTVKDLDLSQNPLGNQGIQAISAILGALCPIRKINLSDGKFNSIGASFLYNNLKRSGGLTTIICDNNDLFGSSLQDIGTMLMTNNSLAMASFNCCNLKDDGAYYIADALKKCPKLHTLNISKNEITDQGGLRFAAALAELSVKVKNLDLSANNFGDTTGIAIAEALRTNTALEVLNLRDNNLHNESGQQFSETTKLNRHIKQINLKFNSVAVKYVKEIAKAIQNNSDLSKRDEVPGYINEINRLKGTSDLIDETLVQIDEIKDRIKIEENIFTHEKERLERVEKEEEEKYEILLKEAGRMKVLFDRVDTELKSKDEQFKETKEAKNTRMRDLEFKIQHGIDINERLQREVENKGHNVQDEKERLEQEIAKLQGEQEAQKRKLTIAEVSLRSYEVQIERKQKQIEERQRLKEKLKKEAQDAKRREQVRALKEELEDDKSMVTKSSRIDFEEEKSFLASQKLATKKKDETKKKGRGGKGKGERSKSGKRSEAKFRSKETTFDSLPYSPQANTIEEPKSEKKAPGQKTIGKKKRKGSPKQDEEKKTIDSNQTIEQPPAPPKQKKAMMEAPVMITKPGRKDPAILKIQKSQELIMKLQIE